MRRRRRARAKALLESKRTRRRLVQRRLEAGWVFAGYVEVALEGEACVCDGAFVEEAADEGDAVGDSARWIEFWERVVGVWSPVAAGFGDFDEAGAEGERGVAGEVG